MRQASAICLSLVVFMGIVRSYDPPLYEGKSDIVKLTQSNFDSLVVKSNDMWLVEFYGTSSPSLVAPWCGHCKAFAPEFAKAARILRGIVKVGAVDMTQDQAAGSRYSVQGFPTVLFFASRKEQPYQYNGQRTASGLTDFVFEQMRSLANRRLNPSSSTHKSQSQSQSQGSGGGSEGSSDEKDVVVLTDSTFDKTLQGSKDLWLVEFYAPWCGHCKALQPHWNAAATKLKGRVKFGKVDATAEQRLAKTYGVNSYPTIKVFPPNHALESPIDYQGGRTTDSIEASALDYLKKFPPKKEVLQLTGQSLLQDECVAKGGICVIAFLPHIIDSQAEGRKKEIGVLEEAGKKLGSYPYFYFWSQALDQKALERVFNLGSGYPTVVAISFAKQKYSVMRRVYTKDGVVAFLNNLMKGAETLYDYKELPLLKDVPKWDGKDAPAPSSDL